jgi:hypothetical protein
VHDLAGEKEAEDLVGLEEVPRRHLRDFNWSRRSSAGFAFSSRSSSRTAALRIVDSKSIA